MLFRFLFLGLPCAAMAGRAPALTYNFQGAEEGTTAVGAPFVTVDNVLPIALLKKVHDEIRATNDDPDDCELRRDDLNCEDERWLDFTLEQAKNGEYYVDDIFEQVVAEISLYDMMYVLPEKVASKIVGVSWRILTGISGQNNAHFHYDTDEDIDYAIDQVPMVHPLLSTVTYLTDFGEPTLIYEQALVERLNTTHPNDDHLMPRAAYVVMPAANKHLAFDPRLLHGSGSNISKYPGNDDHWRIVIGTNFHTHHSLETKNTQANAVLEEDQLVEPLEGEELNSDEEDPADFNPWEPKNLVAADDRHNSDFTQWESFEISVARAGLDQCQHLAPCKITLRLPTQQMLAQEYDENTPNGADFGFEITPADYVISPDESEEALQEVAEYRWNYKMMKGIEEVELAREMLELRCEMYDHDLLNMNPPLNYDFCTGVQKFPAEGVDHEKEVVKEGEGTDESTEGGEDGSDSSSNSSSDDEEEDKDYEYGELDWEDEEDDVDPGQEEVSIGLSVGELQSADSWHSGVASEF